MKYENLLRLMVVAADPWRLGTTPRGASTRAGDDADRMVRL
jgi:hypothetical protein